MATFQTSGYSDLVSMFASTTVPVFFSEYGCNKVFPRVFDEVSSLYGSQMTVLSGGLVYEWSQEPSNYGLVNISTDGSLTLTTDYINLEGQYNKLDLNTIQSRNSTGESQNPPQCKASLISSDGFSSNFDVPDPPKGAKALISSGVSNPPKGSIVSVTQTKVQVPVYNTNGASITGLAIKSVSGANVPGSTTVGADATKTGTATGTAAGTAAVSAASPTKTGAANGRSAAGAGAVAAGMIGAVVMAI